MLVIVWFVVVMITQGGGDSGVQKMASVNGWCANGVGKCSTAVRKSRTHCDGVLLLLFSLFANTAVVSRDGYACLCYDVRSVVLKVTGSGVDRVV